MTPWTVAAVYFTGFAVALIGAVVSRIAWVVGLKFECVVVGFVALSLLVFAIWCEWMERGWSKLIRETEDRS